MICAGMITLANKSIQFQWCKEKKEGYLTSEFYASKVLAYELTHYTKTPQSTTLTEPQKKSTAWIN